MGIYWQLKTKIENKNKLAPEQDKQIKGKLKETRLGDNLIQKSQKQIHKEDLKSGKHNKDADLKKKVQQLIKESDLENK